MRKSKSFFTTGSTSSNFLPKQESKLSITENYYTSIISHLNKEVSTLYKIYLSKVPFTQEEELKKMNFENNLLKEQNDKLNLFIKQKVSLNFGNENPRLHIK